MKVKHAAFVKFKGVNSTARSSAFRRTNLNSSTQLLKAMPEGSYYELNQKLLYKNRREHERNHCHQFDKDIDGGANSIF